MAWSWGTTCVPSCVASSWGGSDEVTASCTTGMESKLSAATAGGWAVCGSWAPETACCTSASRAFMSVPNSYWTVMMLMPSLENESNCLTPLIVLMVCSSGVVTLRSTSLGDVPGSTVNTVRYGKVRSGISSCLSELTERAPKMTSATTRRPTIERLRRDTLVSQLT